MSNFTVFIFYITKFSGHYKAALNIAESLKKIIPSAQIYLLDAFSYIFPLSERLVNFLYYQIAIKRCPSLWAGVYDRKSIIRILRLPHLLVKKIAFSKLDALFVKYKPACVVTTQAFPCSLVSYYKAKSNKKFKLLACITDFFPHGFWVEKEVDIFVVPSEEACAYLIKEKVPAYKIHQLGIPISDKFFLPLDRKDVISSLGLDDYKRKILVMGGSQGIGPLIEIVRLLNSLEEDIEILVICGRNEKLFKKLYKEKFKKKTLIFGYVNFVHKLMQISDIIVTKSGGITLSEAFCKEIALVILNPLPGQEMNNVEFLRKHNVAFITHSPEKAVHYIKYLLNHPEVLERKKKMVGKLSKCQSSRNIALLIKEKCFFSTE